ncbi:zinc finger protein 740 isoform X1 [Coturnix japonica]|uniref:zinc finger protein 740 isoform X1 n=1 Tax=Coturnix japonica TaxID=93934 RepID=UPI0013A5EA65|nr:zinc finger protein 740 isoform X1 [Coturnix japonica]
MSAKWRASLLACEGLSGVCLVPTVASKKMMPKQSSKQAEGRERGSSPDVLALRQDGEKSRSRKEEETAEASQPKKSIKKVVVIKQNCSFQLRIHKNFICEQCCGAFRSSYHLKRHILIHTGKGSPRVILGGVGAPQNDPLCSGGSSTAPAAWGHPRSSAAVRDTLKYLRGAGSTQKYPQW